MAAGRKGNRRLCRDGIRVGRKRIERLMAEQGEGRSFVHLAG
ncbi:hypothetical protein [Micromonospora sp. NPDC002575]